MAIDILPPVAIEEGEGFRFWSAIGTREQLIACGLCSARYFPPGRKRINWSTRDSCPPGVRWWQLCKLKGRQWKLDVERTDEARNALVRARDEKQRRTRLQNETEQEWASRLCLTVETLEGLVSTCWFLEAGNDGSRYRLSDRTIREFRALVSRAYMLVRNATPLPVDATPQDEPTTVTYALPPMPPRLTLVLERAEGAR